MTAHPGAWRTTGEVLRGAAWGILFSALIVGAILWLASCATDDAPLAPPGPTAEEMAPPPWWGRMSDAALPAAPEAVLAMEPLPEGYDPIPEIIGLQGTGLPWVAFGGPRRAGGGWEAVLRAHQPGLHGLPGLRNAPVMVYLLSGPLSAPGVPVTGLAMDRRLPYLPALETPWGRWHGGRPAFRVVIPSSAWSVDGEVVVAFPPGWPATPAAVQPLILGAGRAAMGFPWALP